MNDRKYIPTRAIILTLVAAVFIAIASWISMRNLNSNVEQRAVRELNVSTKSQAQFLAHSVQQQYAPMESLAAYLAVAENPQESFLEATDQTDAIVLTNRLCTLGYADLAGNAFSYEGESLGNISGRAYFRTATSGKGSRSIEYMEATLLAEEPRILFGVPVLKNNKLVGMLFASKELDVFGDAMFSESFGGSKLTLVTDGNGMIIEINGSHAGRFTTGNLFDEYSPEVLLRYASQEDILANMRAAQPGQFRTDSEYIAYTPLRVSNWYVFGTIEKSAVQASYAADILSYRKSLFVFGALFAAFVVLLLIATALFLRMRKKERQLVHRQYEQFDIILSELKSTVFSYDIVTQKITVTDNFAHIFGQTLPKDCVSHLNAVSALHPETDFEALIRAKSEVELTGKSTHVVLQAYNKDRELRWFRIIMAPLYHENGQLNSICGLIIDVTERHDEYQSMMMEQERLTLAINNLASLVISCNLTRNTFRMINYDNFTTKAAPYQGSFDELIAIGAATVPEDDRQSFLDAFSRGKLLAAHQRGEKKVELEHRQIGDDGIVRWIRTCVLFVHNPYDEDVYEVTFSRDITESKKYQALLQKSFDSTIENMPSFVAKWMFKDGDVILIYANKKYLAFLGTTEEDAFGRSIFYGLGDDGSPLSGDAKRDTLEKLYDCEKKKMPITHVHRAWKMNGELYWIKVQASFFEEEDGYSVYYGTVTDITEQITAQQRLTATVTELQSAYAQVVSVNAYRDLMNYSHSGGMIVRTLWASGERRFLYVSPGILNTCGYTEEAFWASIKNGSFELCHPDDLQKITEANQKLADLGDAFTLDYRVRHKDGHYLWVAEHAMVAAMPNGEKVVASLSVDVTEQKKLEERLRVSREEYRVAASLSNYAVLSYDVASHTYDVVSNKNEAHDFPRARYDVPEYAIRIGAIAPESAALIREVFAAIDRGEQRDKCIIALCSVTGTKYWMELSYTILFDEGGKPTTAILAFDDVTAKEQAEALFNISSTFLNYSKNASKLIVIDLTTRTIGYETEGAHGLLAKVAGTNSSAEAAEYFFSRLVVPEDREACRVFFSAGHFMESFQNGTVEESFEYRGYTADSIPHWYNAQTRLLEDAYTHDIILYVVLSDIQEQKSVEIDLMRRAQTDSLTGLLNRESFEAEIQVRCRDHANQPGGSYNAIIMIDIDKFKSINDTYGHDMGDEALRQVASRIRDSLRDHDVVARFGGDEFIALLPHMPSTKMIEQRCARVCAALHFQLTDGFGVSASIGIAVCPEEGSDFPTLLRKADLAMYQAKKDGGNRCARYRDDGAYQIVVDSSMASADSPAKRVFARTFGYFDLFVDGVPVHFTNAKEKELLAILIDRNGGTLTTGQAISLLWEDEPAGESQKARYRKLAMGLKNTLEKAGTGDIMISIRGVRSIDTTKLECDYYQFLKGDPQFRKLYHGSYMTNYDWSEETVSMLDNMI